MNTYNISVIEGSVGITSMAMHETAKAFHWEHSQPWGHAFVCPITHTGDSINITSTRVAMVEKMIDLFSSTGKMQPLHSVWTIK